MENFYWVKIQYDDYEKCRHFQEKFPASFPLSVR